MPRIEHPVEIHEPSRRPIPVGRIIADSALWATLLGAVAAALGDKRTAGLVLLVPLSIVLGVTNGIVVSFVLWRSRRRLSTLVSALLPMLLLASAAYFIGLRWEHDIRFSWQRPPLVLYGAFVGLGAGIGASRAANRTT